MISQARRSILLVSLPLLFIGAAWAQESDRTPAAMARQKKQDERLRNKMRFPGAKPIVTSTINERGDLLTLDIMAGAIGPEEVLAAKPISLKALLGLRRSLTDLRLQGLPFTHQSLSILSRFTALRTLALDTCTHVKSFAPLGKLRKLKKLSLIAMPMIGFGALRKLKALVELTLDRTGIEDLAPVAALPALERLYLAESKVTELSPLQGIATLKKVTVFGPLRATDEPTLAALKKRGVEISDHRTP